MEKLVKNVLSEKAQKVYLFWIACYFLGHMIGHFIGNIIR